MKKMIVVEDHEINRKMLVNIFKNDFQVFEAANGMEMLEILKKQDNDVAVIILDITMPVMDGFETIQKLKEKKLFRKIPILLLTGDTSLDTEQRAYDEGIAGFLTKPFHIPIVKSRVENVIELYQYRNQLERLAIQQTQKLNRQLEKIERYNEQLIRSLSEIAEFRSIESNEHVKRVKDYTFILGKCLQKTHPEYHLTNDALMSIASASMLHDIGKVIIPDNILLKPGRLTEEEFELIKTHTTRGAAVIDRLDFIEDKSFLKCARDICLHHHEKYDGKGYPEGLKGDEISIGAQLVSLADVYDALVSERVYKSSYSVEKAYDMIMAGECGIFNPKLLECFREVRTEMEKLVQK